MRIIVNNKAIDLHHGATLKHALLKTNEKWYQDVVKGKSIIIDHEGNETGITGTIGEDFSYFVKKIRD